MTGRGWMNGGRGSRRWRGPAVSALACWLLLFAGSAQAQRYDNDDAQCVAHDSAEDAYKAGSFARAAEGFARAAAAQPASGSCQIQGRVYKPYTPHFYLAECYLKLGKCREAKAALQQASAMGVAAQEKKKTLDGTAFRSRFPALSAAIGSCGGKEGCCKI